MQINHISSHILDCINYSYENIGKHIGIVQKIFNITTEVYGYQSFDSFQVHLVKKKLYSFQILGRIKIGD